MFPAGPVNETLPTPPNVAPGCPKQLELSLYLIPFRRYCDFKIRPQAVFRTFPCGEKAISKVFGRPTLGARSLMFPAGPVNETLPTPPNVARGFPTHLEWSLYLLPFRRYRDFKGRRPADFGCPVINVPGRSSERDFGYPPKCGHGLSNALGMESLSPSVPEISRF